MRKKSNLLLIVIICCFLTSFSSCSVGKMHVQEQDEEAELSYESVEVTRIVANESEVQKEILRIENLWENMFSNHTHEEYSLIRNENEVWFVGEDENIVSDVYEDAFPFEFQGLLARIKKDGKWYIVNREFKQVIPLAFDSINSISEVDTCITGFLDGQAAIVNIHGVDDAVDVIKLEQCSEISVLMNENYCYIWNEEGMEGIVLGNGAVLLEPKYKKMKAVDVWGVGEVIFMTQGMDGCYGAVIYRMQERAAYEVPAIYDEELTVFDDGTAEGVLNGQEQIIYWDVSK